MNSFMTHIKNLKDFILFFVPILSPLLPTTLNNKMALTIVYLVILHSITLYQIKRKNDEHKEQISTKNSELEREKTLVTNNESKINQISLNLKNLETDHEKLYKSYSSFVNVEFAKIVYSMHVQYSNFYAKNHGKSKLKDDLEGMKGISEKLKDLSLEKQEELKNVERKLSYRSHSK